MKYKKTYFYVILDADQEKIVKKFFENERKFCIARTLHIWRYFFFNLKKLKTHYKNEKDNFILQGNFTTELQYFGNTLLISPFSSEIYLKEQKKLILQLYKNTKKILTRNNKKTRENCFSTTFPRHNFSIVLDNHHNKIKF